MDESQMKQGIKEVYDDLEALCRKLDKSNHKVQELRNKLLALSQL